MEHKIESVILISLLIIFIIFLIFRVDFIRNVIIPAPVSTAPAVNSTAISSGALS